MKKSTLLIGIVILAVLLILPVPAYFAGKLLFENYFKNWGDKIVALEKQGLLSHEFGAAWQDVLAQDAMTARAGTLFETHRDTLSKVALVNGVRVADYPSLAIIGRLNEITSYSNKIEILDRRNRPIAIIRTDHGRAKVAEFPKPLLTGLIAAEDENFWTEKAGFEYRSYVRAVVTAVLKTITTFHKASPQGTSTITQQVAKLFVSSLDEQGRRFVGKTIDRKLREMRLAAAMRAMYTPEQILEVYLNHCVTSDHGLIGYRDIAQGLFGKQLSELSDAECIYLARMVKWGRNIKPKIVRQCHVDMPRMARALGWDQAKQRAVLTAIDSLTFGTPRRVETKNGQLVDCANIFWQNSLRRNGMSEPEIADMDLIDPNSLIRKKGNLTIRLSIDLGLQKELEALVKARGFGPDTAIVTDSRVGSSAEVVVCTRPPKDTIRAIEVLTERRFYSEEGSTFSTELAPGDTVVKNVRYTKLSGKEYRRSCFYYVRKLTRVDGQYYAYSIMDSKSGKLLAYYSKDRIGSRLAALLRNRTPNGSSTAKPIFNALNFDMGTFKPYEKWADIATVGDSVSWARDPVIENGKTVGVRFKKSAVRGQGYPVNNHGGIFEGCLYIFDQLALSNNILGTETVYRLDRPLFDRFGSVRPESFQLAQFFNRINAFGRIKNDLHLRDITGVRVYKELARIAGVNIDTMAAFGKQVGMSDSMYSVALGTLELSLYEQMHLFNMIYNNDLIERPADHPSLIIDTIILNNTGIPLCDTIRRYHPFADISNLRPTWLGLHKRLAGNPADGLSEYDIAFSADSTGAPAEDSSFNPGAFLLSIPPANIAKSGTTDDVMRPFNVDVTSKRRTNYGLWNAVVRLDFAAFSGDSLPEVNDVTIACIGECSQQYTGVRDGKTLHKFVTNGLLKRAGIKTPNGFFTKYEEYLKRTTPAEMKNCGFPLDSATTGPGVREAGD